MSRPKVFSLIPHEIKEALDATSLPWTAELGGRHVKIRLANRMIGVTSLNGTARPRTIRNFIAHIKRVAR